MAGRGEDEDGPRRAVAHTVGETLDDLSLADLDERITFLRTEIERLETAKRGRHAARDQAGSLFKIATSKTGQV